MKDKKIKFNKRVKNATNLPGFALRAKGKRDAKKGVGVCDEYIKKLHGKEAAIEASEVIFAENVLRTTRQLGSDTLIVLSRSNFRLAQIPREALSNGAEGVRANRRNSSERHIEQAQINDAYSILSTVNESIIHVNALLVERIQKTREKTQGKIHSYISGIKCSGIVDYSSPVEMFSSSAFESYKDHHKVLDETVNSVVEKLISDSLTEEKE